MKRRKSEQKETKNHYQLTNNFLIKMNYEEKKV
jgi:hypothetical protein